jgi:DNA-binding transcriptional ArsR family regulator
LAKDGFIGTRILEVSPQPDIADPAVIKALSHPLRARILGVLEEREASPVELGRELDEPVTNVSYHVRTLAQLGLIKLVRETPRRGAIEHHYEATLRPIITDTTWQQVPRLVRRSIVGAVIERLGSDMVEASAAGGLDRPDIHASRTEVMLDEHGWQELTRALENVVAKALTLEAQAKERAQSADGALAPARLGLLLFEQPAS